MVGPTGQAGIPMSLHLGREIRAGGHGHLVALRLGSPDQREHGIEVADHRSAGEQQPHRNTPVGGGAPRHVGGYFASATPPRWAGPVQVWRIGAGAIPYCRRCIWAAWSGGDAGVDQWFLVAIDGSGWPPFRKAVGVDPAGPAAGREIVMVINAKQSQIVEVGRSAIDPGNDVVPLGPFWGSVAGRKRTSTVAGDQRGGLAAAGDPSGPAQVECDAVAVQERVVGLGLVGHAADLVGGDQGAVGGEAVAGACEQVFEVDGDDHRRRRPTGSGTAASERRSRSQTSSRASCIRCP